MEFSVRFLKEDDYEVLCQWWKAWRWTAPPRDFLPENGTGGIMVQKDGVNIVAGFVYFTNSAIAWSEFIISNFQYKDKDRKEAIIILIKALSEVAKDNGCKYVYTSLKNQSLINYYAACGFEKGSENCTEMIKIWQQ